MLQLMGSKRILELDGFRALMAWWVVAGHVAYMFSNRVGDALHNRSAVYVFMALSGFVITDLLTSKQELYGKFMLRRAFRLWPAYLVGLVISVVTLSAQRYGIAQAPFHPADAVIRLHLIDEAVSALPVHFAAHLTLLMGLIPQRVLSDSSLTILGVAWSLSVELQFYIIAPAVVVLLRRGGWGGGGDRCAAWVDFGFCR